MNCPYCGRSCNVEIVGKPTANLLVALGPALGLGLLTIVAAAALVVRYRGKWIYKCTICNKYFIA